MVKCGNGDITRFQDFPPDDFLRLFRCQRGYLRGYKTSEIASVAICVRSCHIMPVLLDLTQRMLPVSCYQEESRCRKQWTPTVATNILSLAWPLTTHSLLRNAVSVSGIPLGWGWAIFFSWEWVPYLPEYVCQILLRSDGSVERGGGTDRPTDRQRDTAALYSRLIV